MPAVLFDFDGTLANTLPLILHSSRLACDTLGIPYDEKKITSYVGLPLLKTGEKILGEGKGELYYKAYQKMFRNLPKEAFKLFPGINEILVYLKEKSVPMAIVTSKSRKGIEHSLSNLDIERYFPVVVTVDDDCGFKPEAGPALFALEKLGQISPAGSLFIGDSNFDILCGKEAGLLTCAVTWGALNKETLEKTEPDFLVSKPEDLLNLLKIYF